MTAQESQPEEKRTQFASKVLSTSGRIKPDHLPYPCSSRGY